jgi:hypothetical protein
MTSLQQYAHQAMEFSSPGPSVVHQDSQMTNRVNAVRHLLSAMMLGQMYQQPEDAEIIRKAVAPTMGNGKELRLSLAFAAGVGGDASVANALLEEGIDDWDNAEMAKMTLALALKLADAPNWKELPEQALVTSSDAAVRAVATGLLEN